MTTERPDRGARALAERLRTVDPDAGGYDEPLTYFDRWADAILTNGAVFLPGPATGPSDYESEWYQKGWKAGYTAALPDAAELERLRTALRDIIVRCEEGDARSDWLPIIARIARAALEPEGSAQG